MERGYRWRGDIDGEGISMERAYWRGRTLAEGGAAWSTHPPRWEGGAFQPVLRGSDLSINYNINVRGDKTKGGKGDKTKGGRREGR
jgi:hypothetical protein